MLTVGHNLGLWIALVIVRYSGIIFSWVFVGVVVSRTSTPWDL